MELLALPILILLFITAGIICVLLFSNFKSLSSKIDSIHLSLSEEIRYSVAPKSIELSIGVNDIVDLAVEIWRIEQRLAKVAPALPENQRKGLEISVQKLKRYVEKYDIEVVDYTGQKYNEGLNFDVLSVEKDPSLLEPKIKETVEPTIILKGHVVRKAKIVLIKQ